MQSVVGDGAEVQAGDIAREAVRLCQRGGPHQSVRLAYEGLRAPLSNVRVDVPPQQQWPARCLAHLDGIAHCLQAALGQGLDAEDAGRGQLHLAPADALGQLDLA